MTGTVPPCASALPAPMVVQAAASVSVTAVICVLRNAMQGLGDHITPLISSSLEMVGKIVIAATLVPMLGYTGVIVAEPLVWFIMVIPLVVQIFRMPVLREENRANQGK